MPDLRLWSLDNQYFLKHNFEALKTHAMDDHYKRFYPPSAFTLTSGGAGLTETNSGSRWPCISFATGVDSAAIYLTSDISDLWIDGDISVTIFYGATDTSGDGNNILWYMQYSIQSSGLATTDNSAFDTIVMPSAAAISTHTHSIDLAVTSADSILSIVFARFGNQAPDTSADNMALLGVLLEYKPNKL